MTHSYQLRVYYEDTDMAGIVYYANYLKYIERARSEWVRDFGIDQRELKQTQGIVFAVRRVEADYITPAHFDDLLDVQTVCIGLTPARLVLVQTVKRENITLFQAKVTLVCLNAQGRPIRLPSVFRHKLADME